MKIKINNINITPVCPECRNIMRNLEPYKGAAEVIVICVNPACSKKHIRYKLKVPAIDAEALNED